MVKLAIAVAALLTSCRAPARPAPVIRNLEVERPALCDAPNVRPAFFCVGFAILRYDGCHWDCFALQPTTIL